MSANIEFCDLGIVRSFDYEDHVAVRPQPAGYAVEKNTQTTKPPTVFYMLHFHGLPIACADIDLLNQENMEKKRAKREAAKGKRRRELEASMSHAERL